MDPLQTSIPIVDELVYRIFEFFSHSIIATEFERWHPNDHNFDQLVDVLGCLLLILTIKLETLMI
jgi:hypothetical protein